jgi:uncharacterized protein YbjT (DUF2867 family)
MVTTVFGARGSVGRHVADGLRAAGEQVRVTSRDPGSAGFPPGTKVVAADLENPRSLAAALEGATGVFLYAKPRGIDGFVAAAMAAGVRRVALLSSAAVTSVRDSMGSSDGWAGQIARRHREVEQALEASGLSWPSSARACSPRTRCGGGRGRSARRVPSACPTRMSRARPYTRRTSPHSPSPR